MNRCIKFLLAALLLLTLALTASAMAEGEKYSVDGQPLMLFDRDGVKVYLTGQLGKSSNTVNINAVAENNTDGEIKILYKGTINGWDIGATTYMMNVGTGLGAHSKGETAIIVWPDKVEASTYEEVEEMNLTFEVRDANNNTLFTEDTGRVIFHATEEQAAANAPVATEDAPAEAVVADIYAIDGEKTVLVDRDDIRVYLTGDATENSNTVKVNAVVENNSDGEIKILYNGSVNGWSIGNSTYMLDIGTGLSAHSKGKSAIILWPDTVHVNNFAELQTMDLAFEVRDADNKELFTENTGVILFHATAEQAAGVAEEPAAEEAPAEEAPAEQATAEEAPAEAEAAAAEEPAEEPAEEAPAYETLQVGSRGDAVVALQQHLIALGYLTGSADGIYGNGTAGGVSKFQASEGLEQTGIADPETQARLFARELPREQPIIVQPVKLSVNSAGTPELYVQFKNNTNETIDRLDFYVQCWNTYGEKIKGYGRYDYSDNYYEATSDDYYSGGPIKPGKSTPSDWYWGLYGFDETRRVKIAVHRYHTLEGSAVNIPDSELFWVEFE